MNHREIEKLGLTYQDLISMQISNIIANQEEMKNLTKKCLSIVETATYKDSEIAMWVGAAVADMVRQGIDVAGHISDELIQGAIVMFVKSNFGMVDIKEKENAQKTYKQISGNLSLSSDYKLEVDKNA